MVDLLCTVRGCASLLEDRGAMLVCARDHAFNVARSGYANLLQPQDRRAREPGDSKAAVDARRRLLDAGFGDALLAGLAETIGALALARGARALDAGSGEGFFLGALATRFGLDAVGIDLSTPAADLAARRHRHVRWLVVNADRRLPFADGSLELVLSVTARRNPPEFARVLAPGAALVVALPAADDQAELRETALGAAHAEERAAKLVAEHAEHFEHVEQRSVRARRRYDEAEIEDLLTITYRGGRAGRRARARALSGREITSSHEIVRFRRRGDRGHEPLP